jgi:hypothetical protein
VACLRAERKPKRKLAGWRRKKPVKQWTRTHEPQLSGDLEPAVAASVRVHRACPGKYFAVYFKDCNVECVVRVEETRLQANVGGRAKRDEANLILIPANGQAYW